MDYSRLRRCACANLRGATRILTQFYDEILQPSGLRTTQFTLLVNIEKFGPVQVTQLAETLLMDQTTLTRNLQPLKEQGLIESLKGEDGRTRLLTLTLQGETKLAQMLPLWEQAQQHITDGLGQERYSALLKELSALVALTR